MILLLHLDFKNTINKYLYLKINGSKFVILIVHIDNILLANSDIGSLYQTNKFLIKNFKMVDINEISYVINIEILS